MRDEKSVEGFIDEFEKAFGIKLLACQKEYLKMIISAQNKLYIILPAHRVCSKTFLYEYLKEFIKQEEIKEKKT